MDYDDIDKAPIGGIYDGMAYISVDPSLCGDKRMCMLSGMESSGLARLNLRGNNTTIESSHHIVPSRYSG